MLFGQGMQQKKIGMRVLAHIVNSFIAVFRSALCFCWRKLPTSAYIAVFPTASRSTHPFTRCTPILAYTPFALRLPRGAPVTTKIICLLDKTTWILQTGFTWIGGPLRFLVNIPGSELVLTVLYGILGSKLNHLYSPLLKSHGGFYV